MSYFVVYNMESTLFLTIWWRSEVPEIDFMIMTNSSTIRSGSDILFKKRHM